MTPVLSLLRPLRALVLGLAVLCLLAQPVLSAAHELHEMEHALLDAGGDGNAPAAGTATEPDALDRFLHAFECCLHATALPETASPWKAHAMGSLPPRTQPPAVTPSPLSRFLRPPIAA